MKAKRPHRIPLTPRALAILADLRPMGSEWVFPGQRRGKPISNMAMLMLLRDLDVVATVHGFRSTFRDWAGDHTSYPREIIEAALAHVVGSETERAYRRGDALEFAALSKCWAEIGQLETGAQLRIVEHLREVINERAQYEMKELPHE